MRLWGRVLSVGLVIASAIGCGKQSMTMMQATDTNPFKIKIQDVTENAFGGFIRTGLPAEHIGVGNGAALGDLDGDGLVDIVIARVDNALDDMPDASGPTVLLHNTSPGPGAITFETVDDFTMFGRGVEVFAASMGDYDNDGDLDVFLSAHGKDKLLQNQGNLSFKDVTDRAGVGGVMGDFTTSAVWADLNNDGLLDLYVGQYGEQGGMPSPDNRLYLNLGDGTFADISAESGTNDPGAEHTAAIGDLDGDGLLDIWVANDRMSVSKRPGPIPLPPDGLYVGDSVDAKGVPHFQEVGGDRQIQANRASMGIGIEDFDNDGNLDVIVTDNGPSDLYLWKPDQGVYQEASGKMKCALGTLTDDSGHKENLVHWGALPLDLDRDGAFELYLAAGSLVIRTPSSMEQFYQLDSLIRQSKPGSEFDDITAQVGLPSTIKVGDFSRPLSQRGAYFADLDLDGDDDLVVSAYDEAVRVYENKTPGKNHYVRLRLHGTVSAPDPVGALVTVETSDKRTLKRQRIAGGHSYGNSDFITEIGLGSSHPKTVIVKWPSGLVQAVDVLDGFAENTEFQVDEPKWLTLSSRVIATTAQPPVLTIAPFDDQGVILDPADAGGKTIKVTRSDNLPVVVTDSNGVYRATIARPPTPKRITLSINIAGVDYPIHPMITFSR
jgi:enediyne biosynthesis protein E4